MLMNKEDLEIALSHPYLVRSIYGNMFNVGGEKVTDGKVYSGGRLALKSYDYLNSDFPFVSTTDSSFNNLYNDVLKDMFPYPSMYED
jgi:hypothetical protein